MTGKTTTLSPETLAELHARGREAARTSGPFVDPHLVHLVKDLLRDQGEPWAASVLLRPLTRRSLIDGSWPWLEDGEMETLLMAAAEEWRLLTEAAGED